MLTGQPRVRRIIEEVMRNRGQRRTDILDTSDWAHRELVKLLRQATPERRLQLTLQAIEFGWGLKRAVPVPRENLDSNA